MGSVFADGPQPDNHLYVYVYIPLKRHPFDSFLRVIDTINNLFLIVCALWSPDDILAHTSVHVCTVFS